MLWFPILNSFSKIFYVQSGTKLLQAQRFNDPNDPCKIMVATDAIGMGLNLYFHKIYCLKFEYIDF